MKVHYEVTVIHNGHLLRLEIEESKDRANGDFSLLSNQNVSFFDSRAYFVLVLSIILSRTSIVSTQVRSAVGLKTDDAVSKLIPENAPPVVEQRLLWEQAKADLARAQELMQRKAMSASEVLQSQTNQAVAEARYNSAINSVRDKIAQIGVREAELLLARDALLETVVLAPFNGRGSVWSTHVARIVCSCGPLC